MLALQHQQNFRAFNHDHNYGVKGNQEVTIQKQPRGDTMEEALKQETLRIDMLKCEYPQGLNWVRLDLTKRYH